MQRASIDMKILLVDTSLRSKRETHARAEPAHFLGMYHLLARHRHQVKLSSEPSCRQLGLMVSCFAPDFVGFTTYHVRNQNFLNPEDSLEEDSLQKYAPLIGFMREKGIKVGIGGWGATTNPDFFARTYRPNILVKGPGELPLLALADVGFSPRALERERLYAGNIDETAIFQAPQRENWIEVSFERPYSLKEYDNVARVIVQIGCFGRCFFCPEDRPIRYRPLEYTVDELEYVFRKGATTIWLEGANFTANPSRAAGIVEAINRKESLQTKNTDKDYRMDTREDSLYLSLIKHSKTWKYFLENNRVFFLIGLESFIPEKAVALGKYNSVRQALGARRRLKVIADMVTPSNNQISLTWIPFWPHGTIAEIRREIEEALALERANLCGLNPFEINPETLFMKLCPNDGTKFCDLPVGATDERYALFYIWAWGRRNYEMPPLHQLSKGEKLRWLEKALQFIDDLERRSFVRDENGNVHHDVAVNPSGTWVPRLKVIDGRVFYVPENL